MRTPSFLVLTVLASLTYLLPAHAQHFSPAAPDSVILPTHITITGTIRDEENNPLAGVTVKLQGGPLAPISITNGRGSYLIEAPEAGGTLLVSFVGYLPLEVPFTIKGVHDITMQLQPGYQRDRKTRVLYRRFNKSASANSEQ